MAAPVAMHPAFTSMPSVVPKPTAITYAISVFIYKPVMYPITIFISKTATPGYRIVHSIRSRKRMVRRIPSPACHFPCPPEPLRMWKSSSRTG